MRLDHFRSLTSCVFHLSILLGLGAFAFSLSSDLSSANASDIVTWDFAGPRTVPDQLLEGWIAGPEFNGVSAANDWQVVGGGLALPLSQNYVASPDFVSDVFSSPFRFTNPGAASVKLPSFSLDTDGGEFSSEAIEIALVYQDLLVSKQLLDFVNMGKKTGGGLVVPVDLDNEDPEQLYRLRFRVYDQDEVSSINGVTFGGGTIGVGDLAVNNATHFPNRYPSNGVTWDFEDFANGPGGLAIPEGWKINGLGFEHWQSSGTEGSPAARKSLALNASSFYLSDHCGQDICDERRAFLKTPFFQLTDSAKAKLTLTDFVFGIESHQEIVRRAFTILLEDASGIVGTLYIPETGDFLDSWQGHSSSPTHPSHVSSGANDWALDVELDLDDLADRMGLSLLENHNYRLHILARQEAEEPLFGENRYYFEYPVVHHMQIGDISITHSVLTSDLLPSDFNFDSHVDELDLEIWEEDFGESGVGLAADGDDNGVVDGADLLTWMRTYGGVPLSPPSSASSAIAAVPEPTCFSMLLLGICCLVESNSRCGRRHVVRGEVDSSSSGVS